MLPLTGLVLFGMTRKQAQQLAVEITSFELDKIAEPLIRQGRCLAFDEVGYTVISIYIQDRLDEVDLGKWVAHVDGGNASYQVVGLPRVRISEVVGRPRLRLVL